MNRAKIRRFFGCPGFRKMEKVDVEGFEPSTSRMQSVRATTVPNAP